jgi:hypothetical protein
MWANRFAPAETSSKSRKRISTMNCHELAARIERLQPEANARDVARLCLLLANTVDHLDGLRREDQLTDAWQGAQLRLHAATDQHAAMTEDLEQLAAMDPRQFTLQEVWTLIRAIKVQSNILQLYVGQPVLETGG